MRRLAVPLLLALPVVATAGDVAGEPTAPRAPDRSLLRRPLVPSAEACPTWIDSREFRVQRGEATGGVRADTLAAARANGVAALAATLCKGQETSPRCLAALRNVAPLGPGEWQRRGLSGWACASVAIEEEVLNARDHDLATLAADLDALATSLRTAAGTAPLQVEPPRWQASGCPAGEVGAHLFTLLRQRLTGVSLADPALPTPGARRVRLEVSMAGDRVALAALTRAEGDPGWVPLQGVTFAADLFQVRADDDRTCPSEADLGLPGGSRIGKGDLGVQLFAAGPGGLFCDGEQVTPRVEVTAPSRIRLYSLEGDGEGFQVWPHRAEDDRVWSPTDPPRLPPFTATRTFDGSDSRLLVVAWPADATALPPPTFCRLPAPLRLAAEGSTAVASLSFHVAAAGERLCLTRGDAPGAAAARSHAEAAIRQAPTCPSNP